MITLIIVFITTLIFFRLLTLKPRNYPPGPPCLPLIGSALFVKSENFHFYLEDIKKRYGPVIGFKFGPTYAVGVTGAKEAKEIFTREEFQGRPQGFAQQGLMFSEGEFWSVQRKFTIRHLREFGFGKNSAESIILEEAEEFFENVLRKNKIVQVSGLFTVSAINVLWAMTGGKRYSHNDDEFKHLLNCLQRRFREGKATGGVSGLFPIVKKLFPIFFKEEIETEMLLNKFLQKSIDEHKSAQTCEARDFIDVYLTELQKKDLHFSFSEKTLRNVCSDVFSAGAESVGNSLGFCVLYLVLYPEWQEQLYQEVKAYTDETSSPFLGSRKSFPKVEAFLSEVTRCNTIASLAVPHKATVDTYLNGYFIPKDTLIFNSIWCILQDKDHWKDPENFRPERFLDEDGNYKRDDEWIPAFGMGKRICPGEALARSIIFVYFIAMIREFKFSIPEGHPKPSTICLPGFTNAPRPFEVKIEIRNQN